MRPPEGGGGEPADGNQGAAQHLGGVGDVDEDAVTSTLLFLLAPPCARLQCVVTRKLARKTPKYEAKLFENLSFF